MFFLKNNIFIMKNNYKNNPTPKLKEGNKVFLIQSGKKRKVQDYQTYLNIKTKKRSAIDGQNLIADKDFIVFVNSYTLDHIPDGPDIITNSDNSSNIYISSLEINIYPRTLEEYLEEYNTRRPNGI